MVVLGYNTGPKEMGSRSANEKMDNDVRRLRVGWVIR